MLGGTDLEKEQQNIMERAFQTRIIYGTPNGAIYLSGVNNTRSPQIEVRSIELFGVSVIISLDMGRTADRRCIIQATAVIGSPFQQVLDKAIKAQPLKLKRNWSIQTVAGWYGETPDAFQTAFCPMLLPVVPPALEVERTMLLALARTEVFLLLSVLEQVMLENGIHQEEIVLREEEATSA